MRAPTTTSARPGVTLIEVLVAIFVMAVGLLALLTLFPLGALTMAQAIKDDRCGMNAANVTASFRSAWKALVENAGGGDPDANLSSAMLNGYGQLPDRTGQDGPSYPAYLDPFGWLTYNGTPYRTWLGGVAPNAAANLPGSVPRTNLSIITVNPPALQIQQALYFLSGRDDITFGPDGVPPGAVERGGKYSCALMIRRVRCTEPRLLNVQVIVYSGRSLQLNADLVPSGETYVGPGVANTAASFPPGSTVATLQWAPGTDKPNIRRGSWVMDATLTWPAPINEPPHGYFYRVVNVTEPGSGGAGTMDLELQTPIRGNVAGNQAVVLDNVVEVFEKSSVVGP
jgi:prepilin-type N-terminal cleavage/methylation domain-containing protein